MAHVRKGSRVGWRFAAILSAALLLLFNGVCNAQAWTFYPYPADVGMNDLLMFDKQNGWVAGENTKTNECLIARTTNGGADWIVHTFAGVTGSLESICAPAVGIGYAVGCAPAPANAPIILKTTDSGVTWQSQSCPIQKAFCTDVSFRDADEGVVVGMDMTTYNPFILHTSDGGAHWTSLNYPGTNGALTTVLFLGKRGWAVGEENNAPIVLHTTNGGSDWTSQPVPATNGYLLDVFFSNADTGWAVGATGYAMGDTGIVLKTLNGGATWMRLTPPDGQRCINVRFLSPTHGYAGVDRHTWQWSASVHKTTDGGGSWVCATDSISFQNMMHGMNVVLGSIWLYALFSPDRFGRVELPQQSQLARINVTPADIALHPGQQQQLTATGYDAGNNQIPITPQWTTTGGTITSGGLYTATVVGDFIVTASVDGSPVTGTATVHVTQAQLARINVTPADIALHPGQQQQLTATGYDAGNNQIPITPQWTTTGGTITSGGLYTATVVGDFIVTASVDGSPVTGTATVHVTQAQLARINVTPADIALHPGQQQQLTATGYDAGNNQIPITPQWTTTGGTITSGGLYTATVVGDFIVTASVDGSPVTGTATVHVTQAQLARINVTPTDFALHPGQQQQLTATGYDAGNNQIPITPQWTTTGGTITNGGLYTATVVGDFIVTASVDGSPVTGTATVHVTQAQLARINVTPADIGIHPGQQQQLTATGYDASNNQIPITPQWTTTGGTITSGGLYTATVVGDFIVTAAVDGSPVTGTATVHVTPIDQIGNDMQPDDLTLDQNYPNPFHTETTIRFQLPKRSPVTLTVMNALGQIVTTLIDGERDAGLHTVLWNSKKASDGVYFYRLRSGNRILTRTMITLR